MTSLRVTVQLTEGWQKCTPSTRLLFLLFYGIKQLRKLQLNSNAFDFINRINNNYKFVYFIFLNWSQSRLFVVWELHNEDNASTYQIYVNPRTFPARDRVTLHKWEKKYCHETIDSLPSDLTLDYVVN